MFYKKKGKPEEGEILICTVKRILPHAVFANIDEYEHAEGMIHISEIAPGRIRNLRDYVIEGKRIVCKVINVNKQGNIDLSLRRVPTSLMVSKLNYYKQEEKAEKLVEQIGKEASYDIKKFYEEIGYKIIEKHGSLYEFFNEVVRKGKAIVDELKPSQKFGDALFKTIKEKIKLPEVTKEGTSIIYLGAPKYKVYIKSSDYKKAETTLNRIIQKIEESAKKLGCEFSYSKSG